MDFIQNKRILGGVNKLILYKERISSSIAQANYLLKKRGDKSKIISLLIDDLTSIMNEVYAIHYFQQKTELSDKIFEYAKSLDHLATSLDSFDDELQLVLKSIKSILLEDNSVQTNWLILKANELIELQENLGNEPFVLAAKDYVSALFFCTCNISIFHNIPVEPEFGIINRTETQRIAYKDFLNSVQSALSELQRIINEDLSIESLKLPNGEIKIQVEDRREITDKVPSYRYVKSKRRYKDLEIHEVLILVYSMISELIQIDNKCLPEENSFGHIFSEVRFQREQCIKRNVQMFMGWSDNTNSFRSIKSRYKKTLKLLAFFSLTGTLIIGFYLEKNVLLFLFQSIDTIISIILFSILFSLIYIIISGWLSGKGRFNIENEDVLRHISPTLHTSILGSSKKKTLKNLEKSADNLGVKLSIYLNHVPLSKLEWVGEILKISDRDGLFPSIVERITTIIQKTEKTKIEKKIIEELFPFQLIIIPAVNDANLVELVNAKIKSTDYPNVKFFIALEERDIKSLFQIKQAIHDGRLAPGIGYFFGPAELANRPEQQRKPLNKPKNVNKSLSHILNQIEGEINGDFFDSNIQQPDFVMIWDLEDDPGKNQIWSMVIAHTMISFTVDQIQNQLKLLPTGTTPRILRKKIKKIDPDLYKRVIRFGVDLKLPYRLERRYLRVQNRYKNKTGNEIEQILDGLKIKSDIDLYRRAKTEIAYYEKSKSEKESPKETRTKVQQKLITQIEKKYSTTNNFVQDEFRRRTVPVDIQGILIARMYGESPISPLEWEFWFDLVLPGLLAFRFDSLILPLCLIGALMGGYVYGVTGIAAGLFLAGLMGLVLAEILLKLNFDTRNKVGLSFSAGTTNNFDFKTLLYNISSYPEYNIAEDWSVALELAKMKYRSLLVNGYGTPTYEDSLAPLGPPMWSQHSRWMGGHIQSFPQVLRNPFEMIRNLGFSNWVHAVMYIVLFSLSPVLVGYVILKFMLYGLFATITHILPSFGLDSLNSFFLVLKDFIHHISWWVPNDLGTGLFLFFIGPVSVIILGMIPIFRKRPDDEIMVNKSIDDLIRKKEELKHHKNRDIQKIRRNIDEINWIETANNNNKSEETAAISKGFLSFPPTNPFRNIISEVSNMNPKHTKIKSKVHWDTIKFSTLEKFDLVVQKDVMKLEKRIDKLERGRILGFEIGAQRYSLISRFMMNFGMIYYYLHSMFAILLYFKQLNMELDNQWRQTAHRTYGKTYLKEIEKILINEIRKGNKVETCK